MNHEDTLKGNCVGDCASAMHFSEFSSWGASASTGCPRNAAVGGNPVLGGHLGREPSPRTKDEKLEMAAQSRGCVSEVGGGKVLRVCRPPARSPVRGPRAEAARGGLWRAAVVGACTRAREDPACVRVRFWVGGGPGAVLLPTPQECVCPQPSASRAVPAPGRTRAHPCGVCVHV